MFLQGPFFKCSCQLVSEMGGACITTWVKSWDFFFNISIFFLVIHTEIQTFISTLSSLTIMLESGWGSRAFTCSVRRFLPSVFNTQFSPNRHPSNAHYSLEMATLSPATAPKCWVIKGVFLTPNYLHINCQPREDFLFQECTQSKVAIYSRVMLWKM